MRWVCCLKHMFGNVNFFFSFFVKFGNGIFLLEDPNSPNIFTWTSPFPSSPSTFSQNNNKNNYLISFNVIFTPMKIPTFILPLHQ